MEQLKQNARHCDCEQHEAGSTSLRLRSATAEKQEARTLANKFLLRFNNKNNV